jgi:hypothetical protein
VREREVTIANQADSILDAGPISQISATVQESGAARAKAITQSLGKIEEALAQSLERDGSMPVGCVGEGRGQPPRGTFKQSKNALGLPNGKKSWNLPRKCSQWRPRFNR